MFARRSKPPRSKSTRSLSPDVIADRPSWVWPRQGPAAWTALPMVGVASDAVVDRGGAMSARLGGWSLDWWVGAEDRWHHPSQEVAVRQECVDGAPAVATRMRVPGGDIVASVVAVPGAGPAAGASLALIEVANEGSVPVALALVVRPAGPLGPTPVHRLDLTDDVLRVDGRIALLFSSPPRQALVGAGDVDLAAVLATGDGGAGGSGSIEADDGLAQGAYVFPLTHQHRVRAALVLEPAAFEDAVASPVSGSAVVASQADIESVVGGWARHGELGTRIVLPPGRLADATAVVKANVLGFAASVRPAGADSAELLLALAEMGRTDEAMRWFGTWLDDARYNGSFAGPDGDAGEATGAALAAIGEHWALSHDRFNLEPLVGPVAKAAHWIEKAASKGRGDALGLDGSPLGHWWLAGLRGAAEFLHGVGQGEAGDLVGERLGRVAALVPSPDGAPAGVAGVEVAAGEDRDVVEAFGRALDASRRRDLVALWRRIEGLLDLGAPTWAWTRVDPGGLTGGRDAGTPAATVGVDDGHSRVAAARCFRLIRSVLVQESVEASGHVIDLAPGVPSEWYGQSIELHDAPTRAGVISFALRWHGARPALLWDLVPHDLDAAPPIVELRSPTLDPSWSTHELRGEALLAEPATESALVITKKPPPTEGASFT